MLDIIMLVGGAATGFIFKMMAQAQADRQQQMELAIAGGKATTASQDSASKRSGKFPRIFIVLTMFSILAMLTVGAGFFDIPVQIVTIPEPASYFFGLFKESAVPVITSVKGMIYDDTIRQSILALLGYYFGQGTASRN